ncbi:MAG: CinA family protein [Paludibacteraceae bacterium]|nr:CinA family protein [Paludibacteraceae bacterium]
MNKITISTAESCTGGNIAHLITSVAGSSAYYKGGVVSYCNEVKINVLGVKASDIETYGVVSSQVAEAMAKGVRKLMDTDYAVATTGVAGPGASEGIPAGTVWVGICSRTEVKSKCLHLGTERIKNIDEASRLALDFLNNEFGLNLTYK